MTNEISVFYLRDRPSLKTKIILILSEFGRSSSIPFPLAGRPDGHLQLQME